MKVGKAWQNVGDWRLVRQFCSLCLKGLTCQPKGSRLDLLPGKPLRIFNIVSLIW